MTFSLRVSRKAQAALLSLSDDEYEKVRSRLLRLSDNPYPGKDGDKEKLYENKYRIHISRTYTAIHRILKDKKMVCIEEFGFIGEMHKIY